MVVGEGKLLKVTAIGVYLEEGAVPILAGKWKGKTAEELMDSVEFFRDIVTGNALFLRLEISFIGIWSVVKLIR